MIESVEDARKYVETLTKGLMELSKVSVEAGLNSHAGLLVAIAAALNGPTTDIEKYINFSKIQVEMKVAEMRFDGNKGD